MNSENFSFCVAVGLAFYCRLQRAGKANAQMNTCSLNGLCVLMAKILSTTKKCLFLLQSEHNLFSL